MFSPLPTLIDSAAIGQQPHAINSEAGSTVKRLFMLFHGWYGNLLISRYNTGETGLDGKDKGVASAMKVWQGELARFAAEDIETAARRCQVDHPKYPPTLPEFVAICKAVQPRRAAPESQFKIPWSPELKSSYSARARANAMATYRARTMADAGAVWVESGVPGLQVLVAKAVGLAGGDEVATLRRFDAERRTA